MCGVFCYTVRDGVSECLSVYVSVCVHFHACIYIYVQRVY